MKIQRVSLGFVNVFLIMDQGNLILVDTGVKGSSEKITQAIIEAGFSPGDVNLILLTHGHSDHVGGLAEMVKVTGAPVMMSLTEYQMQMAGEDDALGTNILTRAMTRLLPLEQMSIKEPDYLIEDSFDLAPFGIRAGAYQTPGHTRGSISVMTYDGQAIVGDCLMAFLPWRTPGKPVIASDLSEIKASMEMLLSGGAKTFWLSHGRHYEAPRIKGVLSEFLALPERKQV